MDKVVLTQELVKIFGEEAEKQIRIAVDPGSVGERVRQLEERLAKTKTMADCLSIYTESPTSSWVERKALIKAINHSVTLKDSLIILESIEPSSAHGGRTDLDAEGTHLLQKILNQVRTLDEVVKVRTSINQRRMIILSDQFLLRAVALTQNLAECLEILALTTDGSHEEFLAVEKAISYVKSVNDWVKIFKTLSRYSEHSVQTYRCILAVKDILEKANPELPFVEPA